MEQAEHMISLGQLLVSKNKRIGAIMHSAGLQALLLTSTSPGGAALVLLIVEGGGNVAYDIWGLCCGM